MKKVLVTGADGFTGAYLLSELASSGYDVVGTSRQEGVRSSHRLVACDVTNLESLKSVLQQERPDGIIHLAAISFPAHGNQLDFFNVNVLGTENLLLATREVLPNIEKLVLASSANVYGRPDLAVLGEDLCPAPVNMYGISKLSMEHIAATFMDDLPIIITRPFNYTGAGQDSKFLIPKIVSHFVQQKADIELGNTQVWRDFTDVRDVVRIYKLLLESNTHQQTVNICSGSLYSLEEIIERMSSYAGYDIQVHINPKFVRENEIPKLRGDTQKLHTILGEYEYIPFEDTLKWMFQSG